MPGSDVLVVVPSTWNSYNVESRKYDVPVVKLDREAVAENLSAMIMLKDNHIDFAGGVTKALEKTMLYLRKHDLSLKIIVEARDLDEIQAILDHGGADRILIDNFGIQDTKKAVSLIGDQCQTESSGGINEVTLRHYAECGVDFISSGALTHSVHNLDLSLKAFK